VTAAKKGRLTANTQNTAAAITSWSLVTAKRRNRLGKDRRDGAAVAGNDSDMRPISPDRPEARLKGGFAPAAGVAVLLFAPASDRYAPAAN
jgi:hypothetical protein